MSVELGERRVEDLCWPARCFYCGKQPTKPVTPYSSASCPIPGAKPVLLPVCSECDRITWTGAVMYFLGLALIVLALAGPLFFGLRSMQNYEGAGGVLALGLLLRWLGKRRNGSALDSLALLIRSEMVGGELEFRFDDGAIFTEFCAANENSPGSGIVFDTAKEGAPTAMDLPEPAPRPQPASPAANTIGSDTLSPATEERKAFRWRLALCISLPLSLLVGILILREGYVQWQIIETLRAEGDLVQARVVERGERGVKYRFRLTEGGPEYFCRRQGREVWSTTQSPASNTISVRYARRDPYLNRPADSPDEPGPLVFFAGFGLFPVALAVLTTVSRLRKGRGLTYWTVGYAVCVGLPLAVVSIMTWAKSTDSGPVASPPQNDVISAMSADSGPAQPPPQSDADSSKGLLRSYPTMSVQTGTGVVRVELEWYSEAVAIRLPGTSGAQTTRFRREAIAVLRPVVRSAEVREQHLYFSVRTPEFSGPNAVEGTHQVAIPLSMVPESFRPIGVVLVPSLNSVALERRRCSVSPCSILCLPGWKAPPQDVLALLSQGLDPDAEFALVLFSPDQSLNLQIVKRRLPYSMTAVEYYQRSLNAMLQSGEAESSAVRLVTVAGHPAMTHHIYARTPGGLPMKSAALRAPIDLTGWDILIGGRPESFDSLAQPIDRMVTSFQVEP